MKNFSKQITEILHIIVGESSNACVDAKSTVSYFVDRLHWKELFLVYAISSIIDFDKLRELENLALLYEATQPDRIPS